MSEIYTVVKYTRESHQAFSAAVLDYLRQQDFLAEETLAEAQP